MVHAMPVEMEIGNFIILSIQDVSHERRRRSLERIFFHDILNTVGAISGCADLIHMSEPGDASKYLELLREAIEHVLTEINAQRNLLAAENNELQITPGIIHTADFLRGVIHLYAAQEVARGRAIVLKASSEDLLMETDCIILGRVVGNMVKNALEASEVGETVTVSSELHDGRVWFRVHNAAYMSPNVQRQVFVRSFSTKGGARGMGTYSIKLLSERYLRGKVGFVSSKEEGTTFFAHFPIGMSQRG
jgi:signal transduction histidine kinase